MKVYTELIAWIKNFFKRPTNSTVRGIGKLKLNCAVCGFNPCICKARKLPESSYRVNVYDLDGLFYIESKAWVDAFLKSRVIVKRVSLRNKDAYHYHLVANGVEPAWVGTVKGLDLVETYYVKLKKEPKQC